MGSASYLRDLLRPLGVYCWEAGSLQNAELEAQGGALDECGAVYDCIAREMLLTTAEDEGLSTVEALLLHRPVTEDAARRRAALAALLRIGEDSFTPAAINDTLAGCGLNAVAHETETPGYVQITFPEVPGIPEGYAEMKKIIEDILPAHLGIEYVFWYITWVMMEKKFSTWGELERGCYSWGELEKMVR